MWLLVSPDIFFLKGHEIRREQGRYPRIVFIYEDKTRIAVF